MTAQPTFNRNHLFAPGDEIFSVDAQVIPDPGPAGEDIIWDFSGLVIDTPSIVRASFAVPDTTPYFNEFPTSNLVQVVRFGGVRFYQYFAASVDKIEILGEVIAGHSITRYDNPETILDFPVNYTGQWQDDYSSTFEFQISPITYDEEGTNDALVDAYGTVILPHVTFDDALRVKIISNSTDTASLGQGLFERNYYYDTTYIWLSPSYVGPLCSYSHGTSERFVYLVTQDTIITDMESSSYESFEFDPMSQITSAVSPVAPGKYALKISPNPFNTNLHLTFDTDKPQDMQFVLRDLNGRSVFTSNVKAVLGENIIDIQVPELSAGMYVALLQSPHGADVQKLVRLGSR
jgi:hypothetical protein